MDRTTLDALSDSRATGLPLSDVLEERQRWAAAEAARLLRLAIADMDRLGRVPFDFERRSDVCGDPAIGRRWLDEADAIRRQRRAGELAADDFPVAGIADDGMGGGRDI